MKGLNENEVELTRLMLFDNGRKHDKDSHLMKYAKSIGVIGRTTNTLFVRKTKTARDGKFVLRLINGSNQTKFRVVVTEEQKTELMGEF